MKKMLLIIFLILIATQTVSAKTADELINEQYEKSNVDIVYNSKPSTIPEQFSDMDAKNIGGFLRLEKIVPALVSGCFLFFSSERIIIISLIIILIIGVIFTYLSDSYNFPELMKVTNTVIVISVIAVISTSITMSVNNVITTIDNITNFSGALTPVLCGLITASGSPSSATITGGWLYLICQVLMYISKNVVAVLVSMYFAVIICASAVSNVRLSIFANFLKKIAIISLTSLVFMFSTLMTMQSFLTTSADSIAKRGAKFAVSSIIPVAGPALSDGMEMLFSSANLAKSSLGVFGIFVIILTVLYPLISVVIKYLLFRLTAFVADVLGNRQVAEFLENVSSIFGILTAITLVSSLMLVFSIAIGFSFAK